MLGSHEGYTSVGLGEPVTQSIVEKVISEGAHNGVYGARISGGGSGGTVVILADSEKGISTVNKIHLEMQEETGRELYLFSGSSDGAHYVNTLH
jgi:galactokinase